MLRSRVMPFGSSRKAVEQLEDRLCFTAPTDILLPNAYILENKPPDSLVSVLRTLDADHGDTFQYSLVPGDGAEDNAAFRIDGDQFRTQETFDFEHQSVYQIRIRSTDSAGDSIERAFRVLVMDQRDPAPLNPSTTSIQLISVDGPHVEPPSAAGGVALASFDLPPSYLVGSAGYQSSRRVSENGRYVVFSSASEILTPGDSNREQDIFLWDREVGISRRISVGLDGQQSDGESFSPTISANGRFIAYASHATNLVPHDTNDAADVFLYDAQTDSTSLVSVSVFGEQGDSHSHSPSVSDDGRLVAFASSASNLDELPDVGGGDDIFVRDMEQATITRVNVTVSGSEADGDSATPYLTGNGRFLAFASYATNLLSEPQDEFTERIYLHDLELQTTTEVSVIESGELPTGDSYRPVVSEDGRYVAFVSDADNLISGDDNHSSDIFIKDMADAEITRIGATGSSQSPNGISANPSISDDGRYIAFESWATNLEAGIEAPYQPKIYVLDQDVDRLMRITVEGSDSREYMYPAMSSDGRFVAFVNLSDQLASGDVPDTRDAFLADWQAEAIGLISLRHPGTHSRRPGSSGSYAPVSSDGRHVVFESGVSDIVANDTNKLRDIFHRDVLAGSSLRISTSANGGQVANNSVAPALSADGRFVAYLGQFDDLLQFEIIVHDLLTGQKTIASLGMNGQRANRSVATGGSDDLSISADGRFVSFYSRSSNLAEGTPDDGKQRLFIRDMVQERTWLAHTGDSALTIAKDSHPPALSADGRMLAYVTESGASVAATDQSSGETRTFSTAAADARRLSISADGRYVAFITATSQLVTEDVDGVSDVFVADISTGAIELISRRIAGGFGGELIDAMISANGRYVAFLAKNSWDTGGSFYVHDRWLRNTVKIAEGATQPYISATGEFVTFVSTSDQIHEDGLQHVNDIFLVNTRLLHSESDLRVSGVSASNQATTGMSLTVEYSVTNALQVALDKGWTTSIYLSGDQKLDAGDLLVMTQSQTRSIAAAETIHEKLSLGTPGLIDGEYYVIVVAVADNIYTDRSPEDNIGASSTPTTIATELLSVPGEVELILEPHDSRYFRINLPADGYVKLEIEGEADLWLGAGYVPSPVRSTHSLTSFDQSQRQSLMFLGGDVTAHYGLLKNRSGTTTAVRLKFAAGDATQFASVEPDSGANVGPVTIRLEGPATEQATAVVLISQHGESLRASALYMTGSHQLYATFDLTGVETGDYDLVVFRGGHAIQPLPFHVTTGAPGRLLVNVSGPAAVRSNRPSGRLVVSYANVGDSDITAPVLLLSAAHARMIAPANRRNDQMSDQLFLYAFNQSGPAHVLPPGASGEITIPFQSTNDADFEVLGSADWGSSFPWSAIQGDYLPAGFTESEWQRTVLAARGQLGETWREVVSAVTTTSSLGPQSDFYTPSYAASLLTAPVDFDFAAMLLNHLILRFGFNRSTQPLTDQFLVVNDAEPEGQASSRSCDPTQPVPPLNPRISIPTREEMLSDPVLLPLVEKVRSPHGIAYDVVNDKATLRLTSDPVASPDGPYVDYKHQFHVYLRPAGKIHSNPDEVFVVTHGWKGTIGGSPTDYLARLLKERRDVGRNVNVYLLDWTEGAVAGLPAGPAANILPTAAAASRLLRAAGVDPTKTTLIGESFGTYVNNAIARDFALAGGAGIQSNTAVAQFQIAKTINFNPANTNPLPNGWQIGNAERTELTDFRFARDNIVWHTESAADHNLPMASNTLYSRGADLLMHTPTNNTVDQHISGIPFLIQDILHGGSIVDRDARSFHTTESSEHFDGAVFMANCDEFLKPTDAGNTNYGPEFLQTLASAPFGSPIADYRLRQRPVRVRFVGSVDPNEIRGPAGAGEEKFISDDVTLPYDVLFENDPVKATAPAQDVLIKLQLDDDLDWTSFELGVAGFGSNRIEVPRGIREYQGTLRTTNLDGSPLLVQYDAGIDLSTGVVHWFFRSLDPNTMQPPEDPFAGFLPVNDSTHRGEGFVSFTVQPRQGLLSGARIDATASILFDTNEPIETEPVFNTVDSSAPMSHLVTGPEFTSRFPVALSWSGFDENGSGIHSFDIYMSKQGGPYELWRPGSQVTEAVFEPEIGKTYSFLTLSRDNVGNEEWFPKDASRHVTAVAPLRVSVKGQDLFIETADDLDHADVMLALADNHLRIRALGLQIEVSGAGATGNGSDEVGIPLGAFSGAVRIRASAGDDQIHLDASISQAFAGRLLLATGEGNDTIIADGQGLQLLLQQFEDAESIDLRGGGSNKLVVSDDDSQRGFAQLRVEIDRNDQVSFGTAWRVPSDCCSIIGGVFYRVIQSQVSTIFLHSPVHLQNPVLPFDVGNDGVIAPLDVLLIINELNARIFSNGAGLAFDPVELNGDSDPSNDFDGRFRDVNGDGFFTPIDALVIINFLHRDAADAESECPAQSTVGVPFVLLASAYSGSSSPSGYVARHDLAFPVHHSLPLGGTDEINSVSVTAARHAGFARYRLEKPELRVIDSTCGELEELLGILAHDRRHRQDLV